mgnify:CR=1 FL=1
MRVLVTGCNGQVGYCLTELLLKESNVTLLALNKSELDITNYDAVKEVVQNFKPSVVINAAAYTAVDRAEGEIGLSYAINRDGAKHLAEAAQEVGAAILHISTDYVFEGNKDGVYTESDFTNPQGVYGASKLAGEEAVAKACDKHIILRTAWVFGVHGNNFVKTMLRLGSRDELSVVSDQFGGPTYAGDIANALVEIAKRIANNEDIAYGVYHYSGLPHVSWFEFANTIFTNATEQGVITQKLVLNRITTAQYPTPAKRPSNSKLCTKKITDMFSIQPSDWKAAIANIKVYME